MRPHSLHRNAVHPAISTFCCICNPLPFNVLILSHRDGSFVALIPRAVNKLSWQQCRHGSRRRMYFARSLA
jgi:hypothetical protein